MDDVQVAFARENHYWNRKIRTAIDRDQDAQTHTQQEHSITICQHNPRGDLLSLDRLLDGKVTGGQ